MHQPTKPPCANKSCHMIILLSALFAPVLALGTSGGDWAEAGLEFQPKQLTSTNNNMNMSLQWFFPSTCMYNVHVM